MENNIKVLHDQHVHTIFSEDSNEDYENYLKIAIDNGCSYFITTEHLDININDSHYDWIADYQKQKELINVLQEKHKEITILQGIEVGYKLKIEDRIKAKKIVDSLPFDLINLSIHDVGNIDFYHYKDFLKRGIDLSFNLYYDAMLEGVSNEDFDVLSHIDYAYKSVYLEDKEYDFLSCKDKLEKIFKVLVKRNKTLEINTKVQRVFENEDHLRSLLRLYKECGGIDLTLSSDAHFKEYYLYCFEKYKNIIKEEGFDHLCYFVKRVKYYYYI